MKSCCTHSLLEIQLLRCLLIDHGCGVGTCCLYLLSLLSHGSASLAVPKGSLLAWSFPHTIPPTHHRLPAGSNGDGSAPHSCRSLLSFPAKLIRLFKRFLLSARTCFTPLGAFWGCGLHPEMRSWFCSLLLLWDRWCSSCLFPWAECRKQASCFHEHRKLNENRFVLASFRLGSLARCGWYNCLHDHYISASNSSPFCEQFLIVH